MIKTKWITGLATTLLILSIIFMVGKVGSFFSELFIIVKKVITPFFIGLIIAYLLNPIINFLTRFRFPRWLAILIIYGIFFSILYFAIVKGGPILLQEFRELSANIPELMGSFRKWTNSMEIQQSVIPFSLHGKVMNGMNTLGATVTGYVTGLFTNINALLDKILTLFLIPFIVFYLLKDMKPMHRAVLMVIPGTYRVRVSRVLHDIDFALGQYIRGQLLVCLVLGFLTYIGYKMIHLPYAGALAFIVGITDIIPYIGPFIGAAPAILLSLTVSWEMALFVTGINIVTQVLEGNVLSPFIVGRTLHLHPLLIIFAVMVGGEVAGITGLIFAVPLVAIGKVIIQHILHHLVKRPDIS